MSTKAEYRRSIEAALEIPSAECYFLREALYKMPYQALRELDFHLAKIRRRLLNARLEYLQKIGKHP